MRRYRMQIVGPQGSPWLTTFYWEDILGGDAQSGVDTLGGAWDILKPEMDNACSIAGETFVDTVDPATGQITDQDSVTPYNAQGVSTGDPLPYQTQGLVLWKTGNFIDGRQVQGKTYIPGLNVGNNTNTGLPTTGILGVFANFIDSIVTNGDCQPVVWSRKNGTTVPIVAGAAPRKWAVLRSRRD
jgi:hypothetical protein